MRLVLLQAVIRAAILVELLTFSLSVLFMLVGSEHTGTAMVYPRFYRDATLCPPANSSVPMKLSAGRKSTGGKEDNAGASLGRRFPPFAFVLCVYFLFVSSSSVSSRFRVDLILDRNAFLCNEKRKKSVSLDARSRDIEL